MIIFELSDVLALCVASVGLYHVSKWCVTKLLKRFFKPKPVCRYYYYYYYYTIHGDWVPCTKEYYETLKNQGFKVVARVK